MYSVDVALRVIGTIHAVYSVVVTVVWGNCVTNFARRSVSPDTFVLNAKIGQNSYAGCGRHGHFGVASLTGSLITLVDRGTSSVRTTTPVRVVRAACVNMHWPGLMG